jgi:uncharacterized protein GlcG (DUF336 family)
MKTKPVLTLDEARQIVAAAEEEARKNDWPVAIAVVDDGGHLLCFGRMDNVAPIAAYIAPNKAKTAAMGVRESRIYEDMINNGRYAVLSVPYIEGMLEGGLPIMVGEQCIGAVGVSGAKSHEDVIIARAGIAAVAKSS